jgi:hypothetical protein
MASLPTPPPKFEPSDDARIAARLIEGPVTWAERIADRLNPIFIKETRQALKSRQFLIAFFLMLVAGWIVSMTVLLAERGNLEYSNAGQGMFIAFFVVLAAAISVVVPFGAFRSLLTEREDATYEPLTITLLTPRQIVVGKFLSALLQTFLYGSAIAPFMAFTALLQGFDMAFVTLMLLTGLGASCFVTTASLAISSMVKSRVWQTIISLAVLAGLLFMFGVLWALAVEPYWIDWREPWFWAAVLSWSAAGVTYIVVLQQVAVVNLTFQSDNRSTGLRLICLGQMAVLWSGVLIALVYFTGLTGVGSGMSGGYIFEGLVFIGGVISFLHWTLWGLFFATERDELSQRVVRKLPQNAFVRAVLSPLYPGGQRGLLFVLLNLVLACAAVVGLMYYGGAADGIAELPTFVAAGLYIVIAINFCALVARWGMHWSGGITPIHARVIAVLLIAVGQTLPMFILLFSRYDMYNSYSIFYTLNLFITLEQMSRSDLYHVPILTVLGVAATLLTLANLPAMLRGIYELIASRPLPRDHTATDRD